MKAIILFGHGSRDPAWRQPIEAVAARLREQQPATPVRCAFLELEAPDLATACNELVGGGATVVSIVPMFLGVGRHAREDLPRLVEQIKQVHGAVRFDLKAAVGEDPRLLDTLVRIASD